MVEPSLAIRRKISPGGAVLVEADRQVALVPADVELVGEGGPLVRQAAPIAAWDASGPRCRRASAASTASPPSFFVFSGCERLLLSR